MGDPLGIGPEVIVKALARPEIQGLAKFVVLGQQGPMAAAARAAGIEPFWTSEATGTVTLFDTPSPGVEGPPRPTAEGGERSFRWVDEGIQACLEGRAAALVTGPINKAAWALAGHQDFPGHTELLADRCAKAPRPGGGPGGGQRTRMMFEAPGLRTILVTTHQPLATVPATLSVQRVLDTIALGHETCLRLGVQKPRIAVCGLNPHASEGGLFGDDEARAITPAIEAARQQGIDASGPWPGDTVFGAAVKGKFDLVVAMYHDQGLIPVKLLAFDRAVNITVGLPIVRTSPDHGTAYDIAGQNKADPGSMIAAIELAVRLAKR
jgi:4-hydroxythreonine-4-phosphate dehydrogenase